MIYDPNHFENPESDFQPVAPLPVDASPSFATASLVMGICSLVLICCGGSFIFGALGIVFALLSRSRQMSSRAQTGLILSCVSLVISVVVYTVLFTSYIRSGELKDMIDNYEYYYDLGDSNYDDETDEDFDDGLNDLLDEGLPESSPNADIEL